MIHRYLYRMFDKTCPRKDKIFFGDVIEMQRCDAIKIFGKICEDMEFFSELAKKNLFITKRRIIH